MKSSESRFKVFGSEPGGVVRFELESAIEAVQMAKRMIKNRFEQTYILDQGGKVYRSDDFHQLLKIS
jgi:hypothetical protein